MINIGDVLDNTYEIVGRIGAGGGGIIFKAHHIRMKKYVAIKLIKDNVKTVISERSEVDILKRLKNEYLPQVYDFITEGDDVYTVMEFIEGTDFKQLISAGRKFTENEICKYAIQLCEAVEYLHKQNPPIIHSDIKPANIMLKPDDTICLIDFNISTIGSDSGAYSIGGSKGFAAPEQFKKMLVNVPVTEDGFHEETRFLSDEDETEFLDMSALDMQPSLYTQKTKNVSLAYIDVRTDVYGIGASLYYMVTSKVPVQNQLDFSNVHISSKLKHIISKAMSAEPEKRYHNIHELKKNLVGNNKKGLFSGIAAAAVMALVLAGVMIYMGANNGDELNAEESISTSIETSAVTTIVTEQITTSETSVTTEAVTMMPNLTGFTMDDAIKICKGLKITAIVTYNDSETAKEGTVISQSVSAGTDLTDIYSVDIVVCRKTKATTVAPSQDEFEEFTAKTYATSADPDFGWQYEGGYYYIDENGDVPTDTVKHIDGEPHYFNKQGYAIVGFYNHYDDVFYYLDEMGKPQYGWQLIDNERYYFGVNGEMRTGWREIDGNTYYFSDEGKMLTGTHVIVGERYMFDENGILISENKPAYIKFDYNDKWFDEWKGTVDDVYVELEVLLNLDEMDYNTYLYFHRKFGGY